jgi:hypothetical protein
MKLLSIIPSLIYIAIVVWLTISASNRSDEMKSKLGFEYILFGDTLNIVDYSFWNSSYTLSNGVVIHQDFIDGK